MISFAYPKITPQLKIVAVHYKQVRAEFLIYIPEQDKEHPQLFHMGDPPYTLTGKNVRVAL